MRRIAVALAVAALSLGVAVPAASAPSWHTDFWGVYFPAGLPGTGTDCPYAWVEPAFCVIDPGEWDALPGERIRIRGITLYELAFSWNEAGVELRKTGYDVVVASANLDSSLSGPTWGTWELHSFGGTVMFTGTFTGAFENGIPAVHFVGRGTGEYEGQHMRGDIGRVPDPWNMYGQIVEPGHS